MIIQNTDPSYPPQPTPDSGNDSGTPTGGSCGPEGFGMTTSIVVSDGMIGMTPDMLMSEQTRRWLKHLYRLDEWAARFTPENVESPLARASREVSEQPYLLSENVEETEVRDCQECDNGVVYGPEWEDWDRQMPMRCEVCGGSGVTRTPENVEEQT